MSENAHGLGRVASPSEEDDGVLCFRGRQAGAKLTMGPDHSADEPWKAFPAPVALAMTRGLAAIDEASRMSDAHLYDATRKAMVAIAAAKAEARRGR